MIQNLVRKHFHGSQFCLESSLDFETISEKYISFLRKDREYEFIIVLETIGKVIERHDGIFDLLSEKCLFEKIVEFYFIELTDDKYIDNIIGCFIAKIEYSIWYRHEVECFSSFEKFFHRSHDIIWLEKHFFEFIVDQRISIHMIKLFLILLVWFEDTECLEIHEFSSHSIYLLIHITTQFTDKKARTITRYHILDDELL